ncbi:MAG: hypothetical protein AB7V55_07250 [Oscillospiraceae bacterium]|jgi:hypothetical protein
MSKSIYSLLLSEDVMQAVDLLASSGGHSRSALVNQILAEHVSLLSPEKRLRQAADAIEHLARQCGFRCARTARGALNLYTALPYKYRPAVRFSIELQDDPQVLGRLRVSMRSQNDTLLSYFEVFFDLWRSLEAKHLHPPPAQAEPAAQQAQYACVLRRTSDIALGADEGLQMGTYIAGLDACLKTFFENLGDAPAALEKTEARFLEHLAKSETMRAL